MVSLSPAASSIISSALKPAGEVSPPSVESPLEDIELRRRLTEFSDARGQEDARKELGNALKILKRLFEDPENVKLHEMRRDVLLRVVGEDLLFAFESAGFEEKSAQDDKGVTASFVWKRQNCEAVCDALRCTITELQRAADLLLDPESICFQEVSQLVSQGRTLPGIAQVDSTVVASGPAAASTMERPRKPWER
eukprot:TRINITY_DN56484_c0_g1_i1.p1 TRINITY_DN56484_c0_g1~~TRINITY_DN56484_c0_g1_i1.p1  ORF type:complete len:209 (+),score=42.15 TRINITY_DN56484_c0_g1_i1:43-627(+)